MKILEKISFIFLVAGLSLFLVAVAALAIVPALMVNKIENTAMLPSEVPEGFTHVYASTEDYHKALFKGRDIYIAEACWHCHSQYVRPISNESLQYGAVSTPGEYQTKLQLPQLLGTRRVGPDLIRESGKRSNDWHFAHLYNPKSTSPLSVMPTYPWFFEKDENGKPKPNERGYALVAYLQWLGSWITQDTLAQDAGAILTSPQGR